ncbi:ankyrin repeat-containing domain protein [Aspergillus carlsbadensis]|nr:ankyrin repeat-containing domain protein [Aspergillus carlsbadensis]
MPSLGDLPPELVDMVWGFIVASRSARDMNVFVQTCKSFYDAYNTKLYDYTVRYQSFKASEWAAENGQVSTLGKLIDAGLDLHRRSYDHPLCVAARQARVEVVEYLLRKQRLNTWPLVDGPLVAAIQGSDMRVVRMIVIAMRKDSPTLDLFRRALRINGIHLAVRTGSLESVRLLLDEGVDVNCQQSNLDMNSAHPHLIGTPILTAIRYNSPSVMELLLDRGALLKASEAPTALQFAISNNHVEVARILLERGISNLDDASLTMAAGRSGEMVKLLLDQGADPNSSGRGPDYPILAAIRSGLEDAIARLMEAGVDTVLQEEALVLAAGKGRLSIVEAVVKHGAHNLVSSFGHSAVLEAVRTGYAEIVKYLLGHGADVDKEERDALLI